MRTDPLESQVIDGQAKTSLFFDLFAGVSQPGMLHLQLPSAQPADKVVVVVPRDLIDQVPASGLGRVDHFIFHQEIQRAVDGRPGQSGHGWMDPQKNFGWGKMTTRFVQGLQDDLALGGHAKTPLAQFLGAVFGAGHRVPPYCN
jgi:hypothetical protein